MGKKNKKDKKKSESVTPTTSPSPATNKKGDKNSEKETPTSNSSKQSTSTGASSATSKTPTSTSPGTSNPSSSKSKDSSMPVQPIPQVPWTGANESSKAATTPTNSSNQSAGNSAAPPETVGYTISTATAGEHWQPEETPDTDDSSQNSSNTPIASPTKKPATMAPPSPQAASVSKSGKARKKPPKRAPAGLIVNDNDLDVEGLALNQVKQHLESFMEKVKQERESIINQLKAAPDRKNLKGSPADIFLKKIKPYYKEWLDIMAEFGTHKCQLRSQCSEEEAKTTTEKLKHLMERTDALKMYLGEMQTDADYPATVETGKFREWLINEVIKLDDNLKRFDSSAYSGVKASKKSRGKRARKKPDPNKQLKKADNRQKPLAKN